jgi:hypothetical protein
MRLFVTHVIASPDHNCLVLLPLHSLLGLPAASFEEKWDANQVADWAQSVAKISKKAAQLLIDNELDGAAALEMAKLPQDLLEDKLKADGLPRGSAVKLARALSAESAALQGAFSQPPVQALENSNMHTNAKQYRNHKDHTHHHTTSTTPRQHHDNNSRSTRALKRSSSFSRPLVSSPLIRKTTTLKHHTRT